MRFQHQQRGCRDHRRATIAPASTSNSSVVSSVGGGSAAVPTASPRRTALMTRSTWFSASAAVARTVARSALPTVSRSCDATAGHAASRSLRCRSAHSRQLVTPGTTSGPTNPAPSRSRTGRCAIPQECSSRTTHGSATRKSANTTRSVVSGGAVCVTLDRVTRAPEHRNPPANRSDSGPRPWIRIDAHRVRRCSEVVTTPASISDATSSPASTANRARSSASVAPDCKVRSSSARPAGLNPAGGRTETARRGSHPTCTVPSGRSNTGITGLRV